MKTKVTVPKEPIEIERNDYEIQKLKNQAEHTLQLTRDVISEWDMLEMGPITRPDLERILKEGPEKLVREKIAGNKPVEVAGIKINIQKLREMVEIPNLRNLEAATARTKDHDKMPTAQRLFQLNLVDIIDGQAAPNQSEIDARIKNHCSWLTEDSQKEAYLLAKEAAELLQHLFDKFGVAFVGNDNQSIIRQWIEGYPTQAKKTEINAHILKRQMTPQRY